MEEQQAPFLELLKDPRRRAEAAREQAERREKFPHVVNRTPAEAQFLFGVARVESVLALLEEANEEEEAFLLDQIAEGLSLQCRFEEAAAIARTEERVKEYQARALAVKTPNTDLCICPPVIVSPSKHDAKGVREEARHPIEKVFDGQKELTLYQCRLCGTISAR
jgi:hypothetical protein